MRAARLTIHLIAVPEVAWSRLALACEAGEQLPSPSMHLAVPAALATLAAFVGSIARAGSSASQAAAQAAIAAAGYGAAIVLVLHSAAFLIPASASTGHLRQRFASAAALPVFGLGLLNLIPLVGLSVVWVLAGAAATAWSAWIGASSLLGLEGPERKRACIATAKVATLPPLLGALARLVVAG